MICPTILKSPNPSRSSFVRHSLYNLNRIGDKQHPCLTSLPVFTLLISLRFSRTLTLWATYKLIFNLLSCQSIPGLFRICINLVQLTLSNAFCQSMKQTLSSSSISNVRSDVILSIPIASLVPFPLLNPNWSSPSTSSIFFSIRRITQNYPEENIQNRNPLTLGCQSISRVLSPSFKPIYNVSTFFRLCLL
jgi:hypothetical protein